MEQKEENTVNKARSDIQEYMRSKTFPSYIKKEDECNFRRKSKRFSLVNGQFLYKNKKLVVLEEEIIRDVHA